MRLEFKQWMKDKQMKSIAAKQREESNLRQITLARKEPELDSIAAVLPTISFSSSSRNISNDENSMINIINDIVTEDMNK